jgi:uncharacterized coiled-coil DUF342 family protein
MPEKKKIEELLAEHKTALNSYREWDQKVKELLKGRRAKDLTEEDMDAYRIASSRRDAAYDKMRHLERVLLDSIPGASTGPLEAVRPDDDG